VLNLLFTLLVMIIPLVLGFLWGREHGRKMRSEAITRAEMIRITILNGSRGKILDFEPGSRFDEIYSKMRDAEIDMQWKI